MTGNAHAPLLVLWDIDQTLIEGGTVTHRAYAAAFHRATGRTLEHPWQFNGRTELAAATEVLRAHGLDPGNGLLDAFIELIVVELHDRADELAATGRILPGAVEALTAVGAVAGVHQSVLTGNLYPLALLKLELFGLMGHFDTRIGAYGGDAWERSDLPDHAFRRAARHLGRRFHGADTVIIGDTRRDVETAHAAGARAVAVATGTTSAAELTAAGADVVLPDLSDTAAVLRAVTARDPVPLRRTVGAATDHVAERAPRQRPVG
ncbi:haloacid dehalogenase-like hydrolase [Micromonospora sp. NPDC047074]|uniref:HAD family hydrolase n=1 Tax=Micromonospora sp. NPDC047074 TaxID=3154339 RepID=UPI0033D5AB01